MLNETQSKEIEIRLKKIEGQVRGINSMIESGRYCIDILFQTRAVISAMHKIEQKIMKQHIETCVVDALKSDDNESKDRKISEVIEIIAKLQKS